jgi:hypothetical protein
VLSPRLTWRVTGPVQVTTVLAVLAVAAISLGACSPSAPAIEDVSPHKGDGNVPGDAPIKVTFDRAMDRPSVESRFQLDPELTTCTPSTCPVTWTDRTMTLTHTKVEFQPDTRYQVHIKPGYRDTAGRVNNIEHVWEFRTESAPTLQSSTPLADATGVPPDSDLILQFSRPMQTPTSDHLKFVDPETDLIRPVPFRVSLDPGDQSRVVVAPVQLLRSRHRYRLILNADYQDVRHNDLARSITLNFTTGEADLSRSLAFSVLDAGGAVGHRIGILHPPASLGAPAPSLRLVYESTVPIVDFAFAPDARHLYTVEGSLRQLLRVDVATGAAQPLGMQTGLFGVSPTRDEVAYVAADRSLHLWSPAPAFGVPSDIAVPAAGVQVGAPSWSGDGRRLALTVEGGDGPGLAILDRATLSRYVVAGVKLAPSGPEGGPRWSFDGLTVAFPRAVNGNPEIWTFRPLVTQGLGLTRIGPLHSAELAWSSDAATLFAAGDTGSGTPRLLRRTPAQPVEGQSSGFTTMKGSVSGDDMPATPGFDRRLAFLRPAGEEVQLWLVNADGSGLSQLTFQQYDPADKLPRYGVSLPRWAPGAAVP